MEETFWGSLFYLFGCLFYLFVLVVGFWACLFYSSGGNAGLMNTARLFNASCRLPKDVPFTASSRPPALQIAQAFTNAAARSPSILYPYS